MLKILIDSLQKARISDNDSQVVKVSMMKAIGKANKIDLKVFRHLLVDPSEYVYDGVAVYGNLDLYKYNTINITAYCL